MRHPAAPLLPTSEPAPLEPALLLERYGARIYSLAWRLVGNDVDAEDVAQNTLLKVLQRGHEFRGESDPFGWIYRITLNEAREVFRRRKRRPAVSLEALPLEVEEDGHFATNFRSLPPAPERGPLADEVRQRVREAIDELPDSFREAVVLVDLEGLGYPEAARLLDLHINAFKTRLHRARMHLRNRLEAFWNEREGLAGPSGGTHHG
ncbi:MAG: RNA polymerase sigma factor [Planctomycetia bacterium]